MSRSPTGNRPRGLTRWTTRFRCADTCRRAARTAYWQRFDVELDETLSVLDGLLAGARRAGRLARRALLVPRRDLRLMRRQGQRPVHPGLQDEARRRPSRGEPKPAQRRPRRARTRSGGRGAPNRRRADGKHAGDQGPGDRHGVDPLGEDPPRHPVAAARRPAAGARVHRPARVDDRRHPGDGLHPVRRVRLGLPVDGGRPRLHRPRRARQGIPLRRRPARRPEARAPLRPRPGPERDLRMHALLRLHRRLPQGRRADGPDHAPAPRRRRRRGDQRRQQRPPPRACVREDHPQEGDARRVAAAAGVLRARA